MRCWIVKFGPQIAANLPEAVDDGGEILDVLVQKRRNKNAALKLLRKLLRSQGSAL